MTRMTRPLLVILGLLLVLSGCSGVPSSSDPIVVGEAVPGQDQSGAGGLGIQPGGPEPDSSTDQIVRDFIKALTATDTTFAVAREFLTPASAKAWAPSEQVTIIDVAYAATPGPTEGSVRFTANRVARVDSAGSFHTDNGSFDYDFTLKQVNGQWRIDNPPEALVLDTGSFSSLYKDASVYFADPSGTRLVPDVRYFRINLEQRANRLVQALLDGPISALLPGVRNELEKPVKLRSAVSYGAEPITVDLSGLGEKSEAQRRIASAQLIWTLRDLGINTVQITNNGEPLQITGVGDVQSVADWAEYDPNAYPVNATAYYLRDGAVHDDSTAKVPGPVGTGEYGITEAAVSVDGTRIATVSAGAAPPVLRSGGITELLGVVDLPGTISLSAPTWGPSSEEFWVARNGAEIVRVSVKGSSKIVGTPALGQLGPIRGIVLSRDGTRLAIIAGAPDGPGRLYIATVQTTADSVAILQPEPMAPDLDVSDVVWSDARTIALLGRSSPGGSVFPYTMLVDGSQRRQLPPPVLSGQSQTLAAAPGRPFLCVISQNVLMLQDSAWVSLVSGIVVVGDKPFYPG